MQIVTTAQAQVSLSKLLRQVHTEPVFIREGNDDLAVLISPEEFNRDQLARVEAFERSRDAMVTELATALSKHDMTIQEFVADLLA